MQHVFPFRAKVMQVYLIFIICAGLGGCSPDSKDPDVSDREINLRSQRMEQDLYHLDTLKLADGLIYLKEKYPGFLDFYLDTLMGFGIQGAYTAGNPGIQEGLYPFLTHPDYRGVFDSVAARYPDIRPVEASLEKGFRHLLHYFPDYRIPRIIYLVSGLNNWAVFTYDTIIGIGLDMYLGSSYPFYRSVGIPDYMSQRFSEEYITPNVFQAIYRDWYPFRAEGNPLLDMMIQRGKEQYFLKKTVPFIPENIRLGYTSQQLEWCKESEAAIYQFFVKDNLLYETNWQKILRYVNDGPNSAGMPPESPGNIGAWLGLRIVEAYMAQHPKTTLPELLRTETEAQRFLYESKYKPK